MLNQDPQEENKKNNPTDANASVSFGNEGEPINISHENLAQAVNVESSNEISATSETEIEKAEKNNTQTNNQTINPSVVTQSTNPQPQQISKNSFLTLDEARKKVSGWFFSKDSSDPLLWVSLILIKNFGEKK